MYLNIRESVHLQSHCEINSSKNDNMNKKRKEIKKKLFKVVRHV